jgi:Autophagy protein Atg8 ubiquitin like
LGFHWLRERFSEVLLLGRGILHSINISIGNHIFYLQEHHEEDFFLYIAYSDENVYGMVAQK